jgi:hypothetical protein
MRRWLETPPLSRLFRSRRQPPALWELQALALVSFAGFLIVLMTNAGLLHAVGVGLWGGFGGAALGGAWRRRRARREQRPHSN